MERQISAFCWLENALVHGIFPATLENIKHVLPEVLNTVKIQAQELSRKSFLAQPILKEAKLKEEFFLAPRCVLTYSEVQPEVSEVCVVFRLAKAARSHGFVCSATPEDVRAEFWGSPKMAYTKLCDAVEDFKVSVWFEFPYLYEILSCKRPWEISARAFLSLAKSDFPSLVSFFRQAANAWGKAFSVSLETWKPT